MRTALGAALSFLLIVCSVTHIICSDSSALDASGTNTAHLDEIIAFDKGIGEAPRAAVEDFGEDAAFWAGQGAAPISAVGPTALPEAKQTSHSDAMKDTAAKLSESMKAQAVPSDIGEKPAAAPSQDYASAGEPQKAPSSSELNEAGKMGKETSQGTATTQLSEHQELAQKVAKLNNASSDTPATYDEVMEVRRQILEHTRQAYRDVAPMTKQLQAVVSMFNDAFAKAQSLPLFSEDEDEPAPAPAPALATRSHGMREADAQVAAAPSQLQDELASLSSLKDLVNPEYLKATERITKAFEQLAQQAKLAPAPSTAMPKDGNLDKKLQ